MTGTLLHMRPAGRGPARGAPPLSTLTYRSRFRAGTDRTELRRILALARARNHSVGVTGALFYDRGRVFQWLEGPSAAVSQIWDSISRDPRHEGIEVLSQGPSPHRLFGETAMGLVRGEEAWLLRKHGLLDGRIDRIATLATGNDVEGVLAVLDAPMFANLGVETLYGQVLTSAARSLADGWMDDRFCAADVTVGMICLQRVARRLSEAALELTMTYDPACSLLIATLPREIHMLGAAMASDLFWAAGWKVDVQHPETTHALSSFVSDGWFHAVILSLSDAAPRRDRLDHIQSCVTSVREASRNPDLAVVIGGRAVLDGGCTSARVGADACYHDVAQAQSRTCAAMTAKVSPEDNAWLEALRRYR